MCETKKRRPGYPITINNNVEEVKAKIQTICDNNSISASALFEVIVESLSEEEWTRYAMIARSRKSDLSRARKAERYQRFYEKQKAKNDN